VYLPVPSPVTCVNGFCATGFDFALHNHHIGSETSPLLRSLSLATRHRHSRPPRVSVLALAAPQVGAVQPLPLVVKLAHASRDHTQTLVMYSYAVVRVRSQPRCVDARSSRYPLPPHLRSYPFSFSCFRVSLPPLPPPLYLPSPLYPYAPPLLRLLLLRKRLLAEKKTPGTRPPHLSSARFETAALLTGKYTTPWRA
jgi:hypothetical protein